MILKLFKSLCHSLHFKIYKILQSWSLSYFRLVFYSLLIRLLVELWFRIERLTWRHKSDLLFDKSLWGCSKRKCRTRSHKSFHVVTVQPLYRFGVTIFVALPFVYSLEWQILVRSSVAIRCKSSWVSL
jgi:hypothetical protein